MRTLDSKIHQVTVFSDRAEVTHLAKVQLSQGEHKLVFDKLPQDIHKKSIQVNGQGNAILSNVKFTEEYYTEIPDEERKQLFDKEKNLQDDLRVIDDKIARLEQEKTFITNLSEKLSSGKNESLELDPEKWAKILDFQQQKLESIDNNIWETEKSKRSLSNQLEQIQSKIGKIAGIREKVKKQVEVIVSVESDSEIILSLSYIVNGAGWYPIYDFRVSTEDKKIHLTYNAIVQQRTGEDWGNIKLKLSTAQPQISGKQPQMTPWRINLLSPKPPGSISKMDEFAVGASNMMAAQLFEEGETEAKERAIMPSRAKKVAKPSAKVETKSTSVFFEIAGEHSIKSNNTEHKVTILLEEFSGYFRYSTIPKLSPFAYLKAKFTNETDYPFLAGETNVFLDNNFVANSKISAVAPTEEFWVFLGIDESFKVEHKFLKKYEKKEGGFFSKKNKVLIYEYQIKINNNKKTQEEIVVWDQLPISQNQDIKVNVIEPHYKENTEALKKNELDYLEWFFKPQPSEEILIPFKFSVEYPQDKIISGL